jgi:hypothetical protein
LDDHFRCFTLEDEQRDVKVSGETRIPDGTYEVNLRKTLSRKTRKYRDRFKWFRWHLRLVDVPGFQHIYIHMGNTDDDSQGCILVGQTANFQGDKSTIFESKAAYRELYLELIQYLAAGDSIIIEIRSDYASKSNT